MELRAAAEDDVAIRKVEFWIEGGPSNMPPTLIESDGNRPYEGRMYAGLIFGGYDDGTYRITAKAYDPSGNVGSSAVLTIVITNRAFSQISGGLPRPAWATDLIPPLQVTVTAPLPHRTHAGHTYQIQADAYDDSALQRVEFYVDGALVCSDTQKSYGCSWSIASVPNGPHTLSAKAFDYNGNFVTSPSVPVTVSNLLNPGFELGNVSWNASAGVIGTGSNTTSNAAARTGSYRAWIQGNGTSSSESIWQQVTIPQVATSAQFKFYVYIKTAETTALYARDTLKVQVLTSGGSLITTLATYSNLDKNTGYQQKIFNLLPYKGQTIRIRLLGQENSSYFTSFLIDDAILEL
jgi:hypothetical protein